MNNGPMTKAVKTPAISSGGVKEASDIRKLKPIGVAAVIVGRSLYEGTLNLRDAIAAATWQCVCTTTPPSATAE
jgi:phosphoribosylformimino-5-aminoimidazole carboxamide ribotide isomerase